MINRTLGGDRVSPREIWKNVTPHLTLTAKGVVLFDDTVQDKRYAKKMALVRRQYSGNAKGVINGIGVVTCVYVNPVTDPFWLIDSRIDDPEGDGKTKLYQIEIKLVLLLSFFVVLPYCAEVSMWIDYPNQLTETGSLASGRKTPESHPLIACVSCACQTRQFHANPSR